METPDSGNFLQTDRTIKRDRVFRVFTLVKFILPVVFALFAVRLNGNLVFAFAVLAECLIVFLITNLISFWNTIVAWFLGVILMLTVYLQSLVLFFTGDYVLLIMLTNLDSIEAIKGRAVQYGLMIALSLIVIFLPVKNFKIDFVKRSGILSLICLLTVGWVPYMLEDYSPYANLIWLIEKIQIKNQTEDRIRNLMNNDEDAAELLAEFYSESVGDGIALPDGLPYEPNIVLIFTEGLSMNVIRDERDIMPNVTYYMENGLHFENYYDHTAATFRGIIGQLYSSHQYNNGDTNLLVSLQSVMSSYGYETTFVNPEPQNQIFTDYLASFGFDTLTSGGVEDYILSDEETYNLVFESLSEGEESGTPQFVAAYTFGTHVGNDSPSHKFGDGSNRLLNRFHYCDWAFGEFMERLRDSGLMENTLIVFTADHATYVDDEYILTFYPDYERDHAFCDKIPLIFYYDGITPETIDADGRNSLDLAPTIMDYLDIDSPNYFLGTSLFQQSRNSFVERVFCVPDSDWSCYTGDGDLRNLTEEENEEYMEYIESYLALTSRNGIMPSG